MKKKFLLRIRRKKKIRKVLQFCSIPRLSVHRTLKHIYAQITKNGGSRTLVAASTTEKKIKKKIKHTGNKQASFYVGMIIAKRALKLGIQSVVFDRSGFKYHGRVKELANSARKFGLKF